jgi:hypothetical protein
MKTFKVYFRIGEKKMFMKVKAANKFNAWLEVQNKLVCDKVVEEVLPDFKDVEEILGKIFKK